MNISFKKLLARDLLLGALLSAMMLGNNSLFASDADLVKDQAAIRQMLESQPFIGSVESIRPSPMSDMYEVIARGIYGPMYVSKDGKFFFTGSLYEVMDEKAVNLTKEVIEKNNRDLIASVDESEMIVFSPRKNKRKAQVTVFTDVDCGYCRKLHREVPTLNANGISVRYMAFPRFLDESPHGGDRMVSIWCAKNRQLAMTMAKQGEPVEGKKCENPIRKHFQMGVDVGVRGTPAILLDSGKLLPGYVPSDELIEILGLASNN